MATLAAQAHFGNYSPASFGWAARDPMDNKKLLVPFEHSGVSFGSMNRDVVDLFDAFLDELVPTISGGLKARTCGCYNPRSKRGGGDRSFHSWAIAIDINWSANPMYAAHHPTGKYALPLSTSKLAHKYGMEWGGDWGSPKDWMHVEVHLSPNVARKFQHADKPIENKPKDPPPVLTPVISQEEEMLLIVTDRKDIPRGQRAGVFLLDNGHASRILRPDDAKELAKAIGKPPVSISWKQAAAWGAR